MNKQMLEPTLRYVDVVLPKWDGAARDGMGYSSVVQHWLRRHRVLVFSVTHTPLWFVTQSR